MEDEPLSAWSTWSFYNLGEPWIVRGYDEHSRVVVLSTAAWAEVRDAQAIADSGISPDGFRWLYYYG